MKTNKDKAGGKAKNLRCWLQGAGARRMASCTSAQCSASTYCSWGSVPDSHPRRMCLCMKHSGYDSINRLNAYNHSPHRIETRVREGRLLTHRLAIDRVGAKVPVSVVGAQHVMTAQCLLFNTEGKGVSKLVGRHWPQGQPTPRRGQPIKPVPRSTRCHATTLQLCMPTTACVRGRKERPGFPTLTVQFAVYAYP